MSNEPLLHTIHKFDRGRHGRGGVECASVSQDMYTHARIILYSRGKANVSCRDHNSRTIRLIYLYTLPIFMNILFMVIQT